MLTRVVLSLALLVTIPAGSQVSTSYGGVGLTMTDQMQTPPPVNGQAYPMAVGAETRSNYLRGGLKFTTGYSDNVLGYNVLPINDADYSIYSAIALDKTTSRVHLDLSYSPGFTVYQHTSSYNRTTQDLGANFRYRLSPHVEVTLQDGLLKTSNVLSQPYLVSEGAISGSAPPLITVISPVADVLANVATAQLTYQFSRTGMIGAQGTFGNQDYLNQNEAQGLYDSSSRGGSAFYTHRLSRKHYIGATYQYSRIFVYPVNALSEIQTNTVLLFYTIYLTPTFSLSLSGGPQHFSIFQSPLPAYSSWQPTLTASMGWQGRHTNIVGSYSRTVSGGGGLVGAFQSTTAVASARRQLARTWNAGAAASYMTNDNLTPSYLLSTEEGGHSFTATVSFQHQLSEHFQLEFGYVRLQQKYGGIQAIAPSIDRGFGSVSYQFRRPLGD
jgi:hypothetical protein